MSHFFFKNYVAVFFQKQTNTAVTWKLFI